MTTRVPPSATCWRLARLLSLGFLVMSGLAPAAHAQTGGWVVKSIKRISQISTTGSYSPSGPSGSYESVANATTPLTYTPSIPDQVALEYLGTSASLSHSANFKVTLQWTGTGTPTDKCSLLVTGDATGQSSLSSFYLYDPWSRSATAQIGSSGADEQEDDAGHTNWWPLLPADSHVRKLIQVDTSNSHAGANGPEVECDLPLSGSASATLQVPYDYEGDYYTQLVAQLTAQAQVDARSVSISSNIETSYYRTMDGSQPTSAYRGGLKPVQPLLPMEYGKAGGLPHQRAADGSMIVDSAAKWDSPSSSWMGQGTFSANLPGFTAPTLKWTWSGGSITTGAMQEQFDEGNVTIDISPYTGLYYDLNGVVLGGMSSMTGQSVLTLKATDSDLTVGENTYTVNWHMPYEKVQDLPDGAKYKNIFWVSPSPIPRGDALNAQLMPAQDFDWEAVIDGTSVLAGAAGLPVDQLNDAMAVFKAIMAISQWGDSAEEVQINDTSYFNTPFTFEDCVANYPDNIDDLTPTLRDQMLANHDFSDWVDYDCWLVRVRRHHKINKLADHYDIHGFESGGHVLSYDKTDSTGFEKYYTGHTSSPTPPSLGDREIPPSFQTS